ncbi:hypothetical protein [Aurantimonas sp. 22II-16-19i]|uniref:hypothetical protein n=1 Tax=Aurantimonas sp. 22II-16-19i TaxID=1317114 RepID=UPI0009F7D818|nr:hypothetical protein [Aurantimonas sp. 22II-16-19i]ORE86739.1 hypothetical protein ATO4_25660 [Aurantimonas sp. 22II-16-19i]
MQPTPQVRYVLLTAGREPLELDFASYRDPYPDVFLGYYVECFRELEAGGQMDGLTVYIVWNYQIIPDLPSYGENVVVLILQDEYGSIPWYINRVACVFKAYGFLPQVDPRACLQHPAVLLKATRDGANWLYHMAVYLRRSGFRPLPRNRETVPLGYARQIALPIAEYQTRRYFISFVGSIEQTHHKTWSLRRAIGTPKAIARSQMSRSLRRIAASGMNDIFYGQTGTFMESILSSGAEYSKIVANTKICLAPRGSSSETYRFFEALRQGCVVICDRLPPHWFYRGCPAIQIDDWRNLESIARDLRRDEGRQLDLHRRSLEWWENVCAGAAVARRMGACLAASREIAHSPPEPSAAEALRRLAP